MKPKKRKKIIILGAGGRDFHNFNVCFRKNPNYEVVAFTATQIPYIENRTYPKELSSPLYPGGIPIFPEDKILELIKKHDIDEAIFSYSDISYLDLMHLASRILASGANFKLMGAAKTFIKSKRPVISVSAVRTGCGKGKLTLEIAKNLRKQGKKAVICRHPMPYGALKKQICQRFENLDDMDKHSCTIEEREEYEPIVNKDFVVFAGVDYEKILKEAEKEADVILWDGGNNDLPFFKPNLHIVICDPHRPGHELLYHPGETNLRMANLTAISKTNTAKKENIAAVSNNIKKINPKARILFLESEITAAQPKLIKNKAVLVIEDGPTVTHGEMPYGAGFIAAKAFGARKIVEPKKWAQGEIKKTFKKYPHLNKVLPALGYGEKQLKNLEKTINAAPCQTVISATPINLKRLIKINKPLVQIDYKIPNIQKTLTKILKEFNI